MRTVVGLGLAPSIGLLPSSRPVSHSRHVDRNGHRVTSSHGCDRTASAFASTRDRAVARFRARTATRRFLPFYLLLGTCFSLPLTREGEPPCIDCATNQSTFALSPNGTSSVWGHDSRRLLGERAWDVFPQCQLGFSGRDCDPCAKNIFTGGCLVECDQFVNCSGNGRCDGMSGNCTCYPPYLGDRCEDIEVCPNGYTNYPVCEVCSKNIFLEACTSECDMFVNCSGQGRCDGRTGECLCYPGWTGERCSEFYYVDCPSGYTGLGMECQPCSKNVFTGECAEECDMFVNCSGHGRCNGMTAKCDCYNGWDGDNCNIEVIRECEEGYAGAPECRICAKNLFNLGASTCLSECDMLVNCSGHGR